VVQQQRSHQSDCWQGQLPSASLAFSETAPDGPHTEPGSTSSPITSVATFSPLMRSSVTFYPVFPSPVVVLISFSLS